jgi:hypothetical protein
MPLVRAWTRGLSGASGAALLVPGAIIAALLLLGLAGSFGRLGGLGQALSGPAAPPSTAGPSTAHGPAGRAPSLLAVVSAPVAGVAAAPAVARNPAAPSGVGTSKPPPSSPPTRNPSGGGGGGGAPTAPPGSGSPGGTGGCSTCGQPSPPTHQTLVDEVVNLGTSITSKLPGPVGQLTTQLLQQVGSTVDKILPTDRRSGAVTQLGSTLSQLKLP